MCKRQGKGQSVSHMKVQFVNLATAIVSLSHLRNNHRLKDAGDNKTFLTDLQISVVTNHGYSHCLFATALVLHPPSEFPRRCFSTEMGEWITALRLSILGLLSSNEPSREEDMNRKELTDFYMQDCEFLGKNSTNTPTGYFSKFVLDGPT